jgi:hypothetical protein
LQNVPGFSAIVVAMNLRVAAEARLQCSHPVPGRAVKRSSHMKANSSMLNVKVQMSNQFKAQPFDRLRMVLGKWL